MKAYKCDICKKYCNDVYKVDELSEPKSHKYSDRFTKDGLECCPVCYDKICSFVTDLIDSHSDSLTKGL